MSLRPYGRQKMDSAGNTGESAESLTSTLKGMLKINGNSDEQAKSQDQESASISSNVELPDEINSEDESISKNMDETKKESIPKDSGSQQKIDLAQVGDGECIQIVGDDVSIFTSPAFEKDNENGSGSNKVRIKPITKFEWEHKYYNGSLVSVTDHFIAYAIKSRTFAVRVISRKNSSDRLLLKGFTAPVCDIAFAHTSSTLIAAVDEDGSLFIWELSQIGDATNAIRKLHVKSDFNDSACHRIVWLTLMHCDIEGVNAEQIMELDEIAEEGSPSLKRLLAVSHGKDVEVWDARAAFRITEGDDQDTEKSKLSSAYMTVSHDDVVTDCVLSPEGSVIAVASNDGYVKFWQIDVGSDEQPTCLHKWKPHGEKPVSVVTFCDDKTQSQVVLYWRFMLTGCCQNSELKIWCTVSWNCLQKISFLPTPGSTEISPSLKCVLHAAADYLVVADINRNVVYVLRCVTDLENAKASLTSISQYLLTTPMLSFAFVGAQKYKFKTLVAMDEEVEEGDQEEQDDDDEDDEESDESDESAEEMDGASKRVHGVLIKLISINGKSLENLDIRFIPNTLPDESMSYSTYNTMTDPINLASVDESLSIVSHSADNAASQDGDLDPRQRQDIEEVEESQNKTALADAEQTILAHSQDERKESDTQQTPERVPSPQSSLKDTNVTDIVDNLGVDEPPLAHSSPSVRISHEEVDENRGQGEGEACTSPHPQPDGQQVLLTPDAFTSSFRKPEDLASVETSFTRVTPFEQASMAPSEKDKSFQESVGENSSSIVASSVAVPPGFPPITTNSNKFKPGTTEPLSPSLIPAASIRSSLSDMVGPLSGYPFHSFEETNPTYRRGNFQSLSKGKSPDLISSASSIENIGGSPSEARVLIGGPVPGAVGGSGDALYLAGSSKEAQDAETASNTSKKSDSVPASSTSPWPKAPDVTMSRPLLKKVSSPQSSEDNLKSGSFSLQSHSFVRPDSALHADLGSGDQTKAPGFPAALGSMLMEEVSKFRSRQDEMMKIMQKENRKTNQSTKNVEAILKRFEQQQNDRLDRAIRSLSDSQKKFQSDARSQSAEYSSKIEKSLRHEMRNNVLPSLTKSLDPLKEQLHTTLAHKLTATDSLLKENIGKLVKSKDTVDAIGSAAGRAIQSQVHNSFKDSFLQIVVPAVEKSCNMMFQQISMTFKKGMDDGIDKLEKQLKSRVKSEVDRIISSEKQAREAVQELKDTATQLNTKISGVIERDVQKYVRSEMKRVQEQMTDEMSKLLKAQHEVALTEQKEALTECIQAAMANVQPLQQESNFKPLGPGIAHDASSTRSVPAYKPTFEQQQQIIIKQLQDGNLNAAFQRALSASDLTLVVFLCGIVNPTHLFGATCALHQPIVLSLIQQLSCDLSRNTELKMKYLQEAVMNVDPTHPVTQEHLPTVMDALAKNLDSHIAVLNAQPVDSANTPVIKQMRMLSMAAKSLKQ